jgi:hypothetical protein
MATYTIFVLGKTDATQACITHCLTDDENACMQAWVRDGWTVVSSVRVHSEEPPYCVVRLDY